jgi:hypothetical protein
MKNCMRVAAALVASLVLTPAWAQSRLIDFAGYQWTVKSSGDDVAGPGPNHFSDSSQNVWVDSKGKLHLKITQDGNGNWQCAEVYLNQSLGYGTYQFKLATDLGDIDPNIVLGLFTYDVSPAQHYREIDIEFAKWSVVDNPNNVQYTVQPPRDGTYYEWPLATGYAKTTHQFKWAAKKVVFNSKAGDVTLAQWSETRANSIPTPGNEVVHLNLWLNQGQPPMNALPLEVVISGFSFTAP